MCDGVGWFSELDYKRMLLVFDEILYLLPSETVEFEDVTGERQQLFFPLAMRPRASFRVVHFRPSPALSRAILATASEDAADARFREAVARIPSGDTLYTWRVANTDGDLAEGVSIGLAPDKIASAHAVLLNKFLLAADGYGCTPISGRPYFSPLLTAKCLRSADSSPRSDRLVHLVDGIVGAFVPDSELDRRSSAEIMKYKASHEKLYRELWYLVRKLAAALQETPATSAGDSAPEPAPQDVCRRGSGEVRIAPGRD